MHSLAVISSVLALTAIASSTAYDVPPFQALCRNIKFSSVSWTADCDNGTEEWHYNARYWGECVGVTAANTLTCGNGGSANWICRNCTAETKGTGPFPSPVEPYIISCNCNNVHSEIDLGLCYTAQTDGVLACSHPEPPKPSCGV